MSYEIKVAFYGKSPIFKKSRVFKDGFIADLLGRTDTGASETMPQTEKEGTPLCWLG